MLYLFNSYKKYKAMAKRKINYPSKRKEAAKKECPVCGKSCDARGLKAHLLLAHKLKWNQVTQVSTELTQVKPEVTSKNIQITRTRKKSNSSKSKKSKEKPATAKTDFTPEESQITQVSDGQVTLVSPTVTQVTEIPTKVAQLPRLSVEQMMAIEHPVRTKGFIEVKPTNPSSGDKGIRYCTLVERDRKIKGRIYRLDEFKSGKVPVWYYNEVVLLDVDYLSTHFDSEIKKCERNRIFLEANKEIR